MKSKSVIFVVFSFITFNFFLSTASAQQISNCRFEQQGKKVNIYYDISDAKAGQTFTVSLYVSADAGNTWQGPISGGLSGDIGSKIIAASNKQIIWDVLASREKLEGNNIMFEIRALPEGGSNYTETVNGVQIEMVFIKGGTFQMGSPISEVDRSTDEAQHSVTLSDYYIGRFEVTQAQWRAVMGSDPAELYFKGCDDCPVERVSWDDIQGFLSKLNQKTGKTFSLPTEAQWEYACRAGTTTPFNTGSNLTTDQANYDGNYPYNGNAKGTYRQKTTAVGSFKPNAWGLYDMHGNVWEWCADYCNYESGNIVTDTYINGVTNPICKTGSNRVFRGGSWYGSAQSCRSANRYRSNPGYRYYALGFRLVCLP